MLEKIFKLYEEGNSAKEISEKLNMPLSTVYFYLKKQEIENSVSNEYDISLADIDRMKRKIDSLSVELEILKSCSLIKKASRKDKLESIYQLRDRYSKKSLCRALNVPRANFYRYINNKENETNFTRQEKEYKKVLKEIFLKSNERFGSRKIKIKMNEMGYIISANRIGKFMKEMGLICKSNRKALKITPKSHYYPNRLKRQFTQEHPNRVWVSDFTYIMGKNEIYYLCVIIDLFSRKVIAYSLNLEQTSHIVLNLIEETFEKRNRPNKLMFHSDQGSQYTSYKVRNFLYSNGIVISYSMSGNPYDNAVAESFFRFLKGDEIGNKLIYSYEECLKIIDEYIEYYNDYRPHEKLSNKTLDQFEKNYYSNQAK